MDAAGSKQKFFMKIFIKNDEKLVENLPLIIKGLLF
jgi:hypothetical protein